MIESFTNPQFPPAGWDTLKSNSNMTTWYRFVYGAAIPDSYQVRQRVYDASDTMRTGYSILLMPIMDLTAYQGSESLFFWFRFSNASNNMGNDDTIYIEITNDQSTWYNLMKIGQSLSTNLWDTAQITLAQYDTFQTCRIRFRFEDKPNGSLGTTNCNFWLDSVKVISYHIDTIPPNIVQTYPANGDTSIGINSNILIHFSEPINPLTIIPSAFNITGSYSGSHTGSLFYDSLNYTVQFNPDTNFSLSETVFVWVYDTIRDQSGNKLDGDNNGTPGGSYSFYFLTAAFPDTIPPSPVNDMRVAGFGSNYAKLCWTAPGDDGNSGRASYYDLRYALFPITESNFYSANICTGEPPPSNAGQIDSFVVTTLSPGTAYYFALKTADEDSNWSLISNVPSCTTQTPIETLLVLNELLPDPQTFDHNNNGNFNDLDEEFIEIYNKGWNSINLNNYKIKDFIGNHTIIMPNFSIPAFGYLLLYASGEGFIMSGDGDTLHNLNWSGTWTDLDQAGDTISLFDNFGRIVDKKGYQSFHITPDFSIARLPNGSSTWINNAFPSPGKNNGIEYVWPIAIAFKDLDSNYVPDLLDSIVTIAGIVTVPTGLFSSREAYIQDNTGGVCIYLTNFPLPLYYGDSIIATGTVDQYRGKNELTNFTYQRLKQGCDIPAPLEIAGGIANTEAYEGALVKIRVSYFGGFLLEATSYTAWDQASVPFKIYVNDGTNIPGHLAPLDTFTITGVKSQYTTSSTPDDGYEILPRDISDFSHLFVMPELKAIHLCQSPGNDGVSSKYVDSFVVVEGVITGPNYVFSTGSPSFYIQDNTAGINVYNADGDSLFTIFIDSIGARFRVLGKISEYYGLTEIANGYAWFLGMDTILPSPRNLETNRLLTEGIEGSLIRLKGVIHSTPYKTGDGYNFEVLNGDCGIAVRFTSNSGINPTTIAKGETKIFTGIVGQYDPELPYTTGYQLLLRSPDDLEPPEQDSASTEPTLEVIGPKTFLPFNGEQAHLRINSPVSYSLTLKVYDMSGRMVRELYQGAGGPQDIYWDGRDDNRRNLKIGIYLVNLKAKSPEGNTKIQRALIVIGTRFQGG